jgi:hypothetical protein
MDQNFATVQYNKKHNDCKLLIFFWGLIRKKRTIKKPKRVFDN